MAPLPFDCAAKIVLMRRKLNELRDKATPAEQPNIDAQLGRLDPYEPEADNVVMAHTDAEFQAAADALAPQTKVITDAIAGIKSIADGITAAAGLITGILNLIAAL